MPRSDLISDLHFPAVHIHIKQWLIFFFIILLLYHLIFPVSVFCKTQDPPTFTKEEVNQLLNIHDIKFNSEIASQKRFIELQKNMIEDLASNRQSLDARIQDSIQDRQITGSFMTSLRYDMDRWMNFSIAFFCVFGLVIVLMGIYAVLLLQQKKSGKPPTPVDGPKRDKENIVLSPKSPSGDITVLKKEREILSNISIDKSRTLEEQKAINNITKTPQVPNKDLLLALAVNALDQKKGEAAVTYWKSLIGLYPNDAFWYYGLGYSYSILANEKSNKEKLHCLNWAIKAYRKAMSIEFKRFHAFNNWGLTLSESAKIKTGKSPGQANHLFGLACEKYRTALSIRPNDHDVLNNWGIALLYQAKIYSGRERETADRLFNQAGEKFQAALKIKPDIHETLHNWGIVLSNQAKLKTVSNPVIADDMFERAGEKYKDALKVEPTKHETLYNWGIALTHQAGLKVDEDPETAYSLFERATEKYRLALGIKPNKPETFHKWGIVLSLQAKLKAHKEPKKAEALFAEAHAKCVRATSIKVGCAEYDVACICALTGKNEECKKWLEKSLTTGNLPPCDHIRSDTDLDSVREQEWFKDFYHNVCGET